jgi:hypothetical protein
MRTQLLDYGRASLGAACAALIAAGAVALYFNLPGHRPRDLLARRLEASVSSLPETEVLPQARRLAELGDEGSAALVRLLGSRREGEVQAAEIALAELLDRWRRLPVEESAPRAIQLARELAANRRRASFLDRRPVRELAAQLAIWPTSNAAQAAELLTLCEATVERNSFRSADVSTSLDAGAHRPER